MRRSVVSISELPPSESLCGIIDGDFEDEGIILEAARSVSMKQLEYYRCVKTCDPYHLENQASLLLPM